MLLHVLRYESLKNINFLNFTKGNYLKYLFSSDLTLLNLGEITISQYG